jgi:hypothetical protein
MRCAYCGSVLLWEDGDYEDCECPGEKLKKDYEILKRENEGLKQSLLFWQGKANGR